jgi:DNA-binding NarL/FixJ family response regulator
VGTPSLTNREVDIIKSLAAGKTNKEIGVSLRITEGTVKVHVRLVFKKLGAGGRTQAIRIALERGIVHLP